MFAMAKPKHRLVLGQRAKSLDECVSRMATAATLNPSGFRKMKEPVDVYGNGLGWNYAARKVARQKAREEYLKSCAKNPTKAV